MSGTSVFKAINVIAAEDFKANISGTDRFNISRLVCDELDYNSSGSSHVTTAGYANKQSIDASGTIEYNGFNFQTQETDIDISGTGSLDVNVSEELDADVSGTADIRVLGSPQITGNHSGIVTINEL